MGVHQKKFLSTQKVCFSYVEAIFQTQGRYVFWFICIWKNLFFVLEVLSLYRKLCVFQTNIVVSWCSHNGLNVDVFCVILILGLGWFGESYCFCCCQRWKRVCFPLLLFLELLVGFEAALGAPYREESHLFLCLMCIFCNVQLLTLRKGERSTDFILELV